MPTSPDMVIGSMKSRNPIIRRKSAARPQTLQVENNKSGWIVRSGRNARATRVFATQAEAVDDARMRLRVAGGELAVRSVDGRIRESFTIGRKAMAKIGAIEGIRLSKKIRANLRALDKEGLSPRERRERILSAFGGRKATKR